MSRNGNPKKPAGQGPIDVALVRELAEIIAETGLTEIEVERGDLSVRVKREPAPQTVHMAPAASAAALPAPAPAAVAVAEPAVAASADPAAHPGAVPSPMVGTAYLSPDPQSPSFITVGDTVKEGDTLLLIEAMKTFNPITAPRGGVVAQILVDDAQPVEYGEALVILE